MTTVMVFSISGYVSRTSMFAKFLFADVRHCRALTNLVMALGRMGGGSVHVVKDQ